MSTMVEQQKAFMDAANQTTDSYYNHNQTGLYDELCWEEANELRDANVAEPVLSITSC